MSFKDDLIVVRYEAQSASKDNYSDLDRVGKQLISLPNLQRKDRSPVTNNTTTSIIPLQCSVFNKIYTHVQPDRSQHKIITQIRTHKTQSHFIPTHFTLNTSYLNIREHPNENGQTFKSSNIYKRRHNEI